jgi:hypothetical protein
MTVALICMCAGLPFTSDAATTSTVDLKAKGSDATLSFSGKKKILFSWTSTSVKNCHLYVARGKSYKVSPNGDKKVTVPSDAPYVLLSCNDINTGKEVRDTILVKDPKGTMSLSTSVEDSLTVSAIASASLRKEICVGKYFGTISWGDGEKENLGPEFKDGATCGTEVEDMQTHTYSRPGTYTIVFTDNQKRTKRSKVTVE